MSEYKQAFVSIAYKILRLMFQKKVIKRPNILMDGKIIILKEIQKCVSSEREREIYM